jgi:hypothetical protein
MAGDQTESREAFQYRQDTTGTGNRITGKGDIKTGVAEKQKVMIPDGCVDRVHSRLVQDKALVIRMELDTLQARLRGAPDVLRSFRILGMD